MAIEKFITPFIESQFPQFYRDEGPNFIAFVKAYYEWMESSYYVNNDDGTILTTEEYDALGPDLQLNYTKNNQPINLARKLPETLDIDATEEEFIRYFKANYISTLPYNIIADKRLLIKHILELYRSKGTKRAYELLFRLLFNEDIEIYVPNEHIMKSSEAEWYKPQYIEVSDSEFLENLIGKQIISADGIGIVETYYQKLVNNKVINVLELSSIIGRFKIHEKLYCDDLYVKKLYQNENGDIINQTEYDSLQSFEDLQALTPDDPINPAIVAPQEHYKLLFVDKIDSKQYFELPYEKQINYQLALDEETAPVVFGSLSTISIINGGFDFKVGDLLPVSGSGTGGVARVVATRAETGKVAFKLLDGGYGFTVDADVTVTGALFTVDIDVKTVDTTEYKADKMYLPVFGSGASFKIGGITNKQLYRVNTDKIAQVEPATNELDSDAYGFAIHYGVNDADGVLMDTYNTAFDGADYNYITSSSNSITMSVTQFIGNVAFGDVLSNSSLGIANLYVYNSDLTNIQITGKTSDLQNLKAAFDTNWTPEVQLRQAGILLNNGKSGEANAIVIVKNLMPQKQIHSSAFIFEMPVGESTIISQTNRGIEVVVDASSDIITVQKEGVDVITKQMNKGYFVPTARDYDGAIIEPNYITLFNTDDPLIQEINTTIENYDEYWFNGSSAVHTTGNYINIPNASSKYSVGDSVRYKSTLGAAITSADYGLVNNHIYYVSFANSTAIAISATLGGANIDLIAVGSNDRFHSFRNETINSVTPPVKPTVRRTDWLGSFPKPAALEILSNLETPSIKDMLNIEDLIIGKITHLTNINPGSGYSANPVVTIIEKDIYNLRIDDGKGGYWGYDAVVSAKAGTANGVVTAIEVYDSGFGYVPDETVNMNLANNVSSVTGAAIVDLNGVGGGYWRDNKSFVSETSFVQDSDYYQTFSYEIIAKRMLSTYEKAVKDLIHPSGLKMFGKFKIDDEKITEESLPTAFRKDHGNFSCDITNINESQPITVDGIKVKSDRLTIQYNALYTSDFDITTCDSGEIFTSGYFNIDIDLILCDTKHITADKYTSYGGTTVDRQYLRFNIDTLFTTADNRHMTIDKLDQLQSKQRD